MTHPLQRSWDALLILHWRRDSRMGSLNMQCKEMLGEFPNVLHKEGLIRCGAFHYPTTHVRVWIDSYLNPLSVKLWDVADNKRVLDWLNASTGLDCEASKKVKKWQDEGRHKNVTSTRHVQQIKMSIDLGKLGNRLNNPNQVKATGRKSNRK